MAIDFQRDEYKAKIKDWQLVDDMVDEENLDGHLVTLNEADKSEDNIARNKAYRERVFSARHGSRSKVLSASHSPPNQS